MSREPLLFVDSSVWIDFLRGTETAQTGALLSALAAIDPRSDVSRPQTIVVGDLVLFEVLRGVKNGRDHARVLRSLQAHAQADLGGSRLAVQAAVHYRHLRGMGVSVRKTVDCLIAAWCIAHKVPLLHNDRDFLPFVRHCGLVSALPEEFAGGARV
jgi:predicted nucleic acid-binding protein